MAAVEPGMVKSSCHRQDLTQQDDFIHAGILDDHGSACGYAAFSLMPAEARVWI